jgi:alpha-tubulin suppressor-like RCC1 family protein
MPLKDVVAVRAGSFHNLALKSDGTVIGWGADGQGQSSGQSNSTADFSGGSVKITDQLLEKVSQIAAANFSIALRNDGTVVGWGRVGIPEGLRGVKQIAASGFYSVALKDSGEVVSWGSAPRNRPTVPKNLSNVTAVVAGGGQYERSLALLKNGTVVAWGSESSFNDLRPPPGLSNVVAIAAGSSHSLALLADGSVVGWGHNTEGQATGVPSGGDKPVAEGPVTLRGAALKDVVALSANQGYSLALKKDGTVVAWGNSRYYFPVPPGLSNVVAISAGEGYCLAITTNIDVNVVKSWEPQKK